MFDFLKAEGEKTGHPAKSVALFYEDSIFGTDSSNVQRKLAAANGIDGRRGHQIPRQLALALRRGAEAEGGERGRGDALLLHLGRDPAHARHQRSRLPPGGAGAGRRVPGAILHHRRRPARRGRDEPQQLRARCRQVAARPSPPSTPPFAPRPTRTSTTTPPARSWPSRCWRTRSTAPGRASRRTSAWP